MITLLRKNNVFLIFATILFTRLVWADAPHRLGNDAEVGRSSVVVEGEVKSLKTVILIRVNDPNDSGTAKFKEITETEFKNLPKAGDFQVIWRNEIEIHIRSILASGALDSQIINKIVINYNNFGPGWADAYRGPLPKVGEVYTFFGRSENIDFDDDGTLHVKIGLSNDLRPPGIVSTLLRNAEGKLTVTERTPIDPIAEKQNIVSEQDSTIETSKAPAPKPPLLNVPQLPNADTRGTNPATPGVQPLSSTPWPAVAILIALTIGLLWFLLKNRK